MEPRGVVLVTGGLGYVDSRLCPHLLLEAPLHHDIRSMRLERLPAPYHLLAERDRAC